MLFLGSALVKSPLAVFTQTLSPFNVLRKYLLTCQPRDFQMFTSCSALYSDIIFHGHPIGKADKMSVEIQGEGPEPHLIYLHFSPSPPSCPAVHTHGTPRVCRTQFENCHPTQKYFLPSSGLLFYSLFLIFIYLCIHSINFYWVQAVNIWHLIMYGLLITLI